MPCILLNSKYTSWFLAIRTNKFHENDKMPALSPTKKIQVVIPTKEEITASCDRSDSAVVTLNNFKGRYKDLTESTNCN